MGTKNMTDNKAQKQYDDIQALYTKMTEHLIGKEFGIVGKSLQYVMVEYFLNITDPTARIEFIKEYFDDLFELITNAVDADASTEGEKIDE